MEDRPFFINCKLNFINRTDLNTNTTDCDCVFIENPNRNVIIDYKTDCVDYDDFISQLQTAFDTISKEKRSFIMGNSNIDLLNYDTFVNLMYSYSFCPCIDRPTRVFQTRNGTTISLIDNIFTNDVDHKNHFREFSY